MLSRYSNKTLVVFVSALAIAVVPFTVDGHTCVPPPSGLVSWWPGDGSANDIKDGNDGVLLNGAAFSSGLVGEAFSFDGIDDYVEIPHSENMNSGTDFSLSYWANSSQIGIQALPISKHFNDPTEGWNNILESDGRIIFQLRTGGICCDNLFSNTSLSPNTWYHLVSTFTASDRIMKLYVDGVLDSSTTATSSDMRKGTQPLNIGRDRAGAILLGVPSQWLGQIDEVSLYNRALSAEEIAAIFHAGSAGKCKNGTFSSFNPRLSLSQGVKPSDYYFQTTAKFELNTKSNGIDPRNEDLTLTIGSFSATIPADSFQTYRQNKVPDKVRFDGVIDDVRMVVDIYSQGNNRYLLWAKGSGAKFDGTTLPVATSLSIGDDQGNATLSVGTAEFRAVKGFK